MKAMENISSELKIKSSAKAVSKVASTFPGTIAETFTNVQKLLVKFKLKCAKLPGNKRPTEFCVHGKT